MTSRQVFVSYGIAVIRIVVRRLRAMVSKRDLEQSRDALARFEGEGGATAHRSESRPDGKH